MSKRDLKGDRHKKLNQMALKVLLGYFIVIGSLFLMATLMTMILSSPLPSADKKLVEKYKLVAAKYDGDWALLLAYSTVMSNNQLKKVDPAQMGVPLINVEFDIRDSDGDTTHVELRTPEALANYMGVPVSNLTVDSVTGYFTFRSPRNLVISGKTDEDLEDLMTPKQYEWLNLLMTDNTVNKLFGDYVELPKSIITPGNGFFAHPCPEVSNITSPYGRRFHPVLKIWKNHTGIDLAIAGCYGKPVIAAADAVVLKAAVDANGYGNFIVLSHLDPEGHEWRTLYGHLSQMTVTKGQVIKRGTVIGAIGSSGRSTGAHLHFEIRYNGQTVNPQIFLNKKFSEFHGETK